MYLICAIYDIIIENRETKEQDGNEVYMTEQDYFTGMKKNKKYWASMTPSIGFMAGGLSNCRNYPEKSSCFLDIFTVKYKYLEEKARTMQ